MWARVIFGSRQLHEKDRCAERGLKLCAYNAYNVKRGWDECSEVRVNWGLRNGLRCAPGVTVRLIADILSLAQLHGDGPKASRG